MKNKLTSFLNIGLIIAPILALIIAGGLVYFLSSNEDLGSDDSSALYGAQPERRFPYVGYLIIENTDGELYSCGVNFIDNDTGLSAAHCFKKFKEAYVGVGSFDDDYYRTGTRVKSVKIPTYYTPPKYTFNAGIGDVAILELEGQVLINDYAEYSAPRETCNYYITGYGRNEDGQRLDRRGGPVCIEKVEDERVILSKEDTFFCFGDSGTGIYEENTNKLVAIVSSLNSSSDCIYATEFYATRVDSNLQFLNSNTDFKTIIPSTTPRPSGSANRPDRIVSNNEIDDNNDSIISGDYEDEEVQIKQADLVILAIICVLCCLGIFAGFIGLMLILKLFSKN